MIIVDTPFPEDCWFNDDGAEYRKPFLRDLDETMRATVRDHGRKPSIIAGISYGGLHAPVGYAARPLDFIGWEAAMPLTKINALTAHASAGEAPQFNAFTIVPLLRNSNGFISWGARPMAG